MEREYCWRSEVAAHIGFLDTLRGFLAFWVYYGHLKMAAIGKDLLWGPPAIAVDGFMLLSGFLMAYHWTLRAKSFHSFWQQAKDFYLRRFFRIAPLYYLLLSFVLVWQNRLSAIKQSVQAIVPPAWGGAALVVDNFELPRVTFWNILTHYSFAFGLFPKYGNSNLLPDWSISLEMQFYFLFPFLVLFIARYGSITTALLVFLTTISARKFIGLQEHAGLIARYNQPSLLLFKINIFLAGMAIAYAYLSEKPKDKLSWLVVGFLSLFNVNQQVLIIAFIMVLLLILADEHRDLLATIGTWNISRFLGNTSYALYLVHLIIMYPILAILFKQGWFVDLSLYARLLVSFGIITPVVYGAAYLLFSLIEKNGISLGKNLTRPIPAKRYPVPA